jgi:hypothetical protein
VKTQKKNRRETGKKGSNIDWKFPQLMNAMAISVHFTSILHIPSHGKPDFSKKRSNLFTVFFYQYELDR